MKKILLILLLAALLPFAAADAQNIALGVVAAVLSCFSVYSILIGTGDFIYGKFQSGMIYALVVVVTMIGVIITWKKMNRKVN